MGGLKKLLFSCSLLVSFLVARGQQYRLGTSIVGIGINFPSYTCAATDLCTLNKATASVSGLQITGNYNYSVLPKVTIKAEASYCTYTALASGYDLGVGAEYHWHYSHTIDKFDLFVSASGGFTHTSFKGGVVLVGGNLSAPGIYYGLGIGARKFFGNLGIFVNVNYYIHTYKGGEVVEHDNLKIPYTINFSGLNYGGGICWKFNFSKHDPVIY